MSNFQVKNIKSSSCIGFTQLKRKMLQHLDDMKVDTKMLLQKIKQGPSLPMFGDFSF